MINASEDENVFTKIVIIQYYMTFVVHLGAFIMAAVLSFSSTALPSLRDDPQIGPEITQVLEDWIASIPFLACALGTFVCRYFVQTKGLKRSLQIIGVPLLLGWVLIALTQNVFMLLTGRFITGFCIAVIGVSSNILSELADRDKRTQLRNGFDVMFSMGILFIYVTGMFLSWQFQAASCLVVTLLWFGLLFTIPESTLSLYGAGNVDKARQFLMSMRRWKDIKEIGHLDYELSNVRQGDQYSDTASVHNFLTSIVWKPILMVTALQFFLQLGGVVPIICYAHDVFKIAVGETANVEFYLMIFGAVNLVATFVGGISMDRTERRLLMIVSQVLLTLTLVMLGTFVYLRDNQDIKVIQFCERVPNVCLILFIVIYPVGVGTVPGILSGEILHSSAKGFSNSMVMVLTNIFGFLAMFYFKLTIIALGPWGLFWCFAVITFLGLLFSYFNLPVKHSDPVGDSAFLKI